MSPLVHAVQTSANQQPMDLADYLSIKIHLVVFVLIPEAGSWNSKWNLFGLQTLVDRLLQRCRTLTEKKWSLALHLLCCFTSFHLWPRVQLPSASLKNDCSGTMEMPRTVLNSSINSARFLLSSSDRVWASEIFLCVPTLLSHQKLWRDGNPMPAGVEATTRHCRL